MFELAALAMLLGVVGAVILALMLLGFLFKVVFEVALFPLALLGGLLKLLLIPVLLIVGLVLAVVLGPVLLAVGAVVLVPLLVVGALAWAGLSLLAVI